MQYLREIIVDNFAGGGGASTGIELATGRSVDIAINHDPAAILMHETNHPDTEHYCESVWDVDPREVAKGRPVALCWLSPDCKHFSKAKGGKPVEKSIRGLAWVALRWAATVKPRVIMLENVEEFKTWGPLLKDGKPDPKQKGRTFNAFVNALKRQGYQVDWRELRACDYGAPTIRKRLFLIARCDGRPIKWPKPTHGDPSSKEVKSGSLLPWRTAAEVIDWSLPCPSIFERKKPLAENTLKRIARGIQRFVIDNPNPFIVRVNYSGSNHHYCDPIDEPLKTITSKNGWGVVTPFIARIGQTGFGGDRMQYEMDEPLTTITTKAEHLLVTPVLGVNTSGHPGSALSDPLRTITTGGHHMLISPTLIQTGYGEREGQAPRSLDLKKPLGTVVAGGQKHALVTSHLIKFRGKNYGHRTDEPLHTITAGGIHHGEVRAFLMKYYGADTGQQVTDPLHTIPTKDRFGLVTIHGEDYEIVDIGMRMLEPHELFAAQGFPKEYIIDRDHKGNPYPKTAQVARCGNSVSPVIPAALVRENLPEHCAGAGVAMTFERYNQPIGQLELSI